MFKKLRSLFSNDLSIDLGTANTLVYVKNKGIVVNQPSVVAIKSDQYGGAVQRTIAAVGQEAKNMLGRNPDNMEVIRPMKDGVIADFQYTEKMLQYFINSALTKSGSHIFPFKPSPRVLVCVPCGATEVEKRAIRESAEGAGASEVYLISEPMAAALGSGLPISEATGSMIVDIGGGTSEVAVISLNGINVAMSVRIGGNRFDQAIIDYVRSAKRFEIGEATAENIKLTIGTAYVEPELKKMLVRGRSLADGVPRTIELNSSEILEALNDPLKGIVTAVRTALEKASPELAADIAEHGMMLSGGGALLHNIDNMLREATGIPVTVAEDPLTCVARGGGKALEEYDTHNNGIFD